MTDSNTIACSGCGRSIAADSKSCKYCGEPQVSNVPTDATMSASLPCPDCGQTIRSGLTSCPHCGYERATKQSIPAEAPKKVPAGKVIVPGAKKVASKPKPAPVPGQATTPPPAVKPKKPAPPVELKKIPETTLDLNEASPPTPPQVPRSTTKQIPKQNKELPPPPGLDSDSLPERPGGVPEKNVHVFLRGLQFPVKPMDYSTLIRNIRERKISPEDYILDDKNAWRTVADLFNLPEL